MKGIAIVCIAVCGTAVGIVLAYAAASHYATVTRPHGLTAAPFATQLFGSIVAIDPSEKKITLRIISPSDTASYLATFAYDTNTTFRRANELASVGESGISDRFPAGTKVQATVLRTPGSLHMETLFASNEL